MTIEDNPTKNPTPSENQAEKSPLATASELILKLATAILGVLYVIGLLISNIQLMEIGIADFTSLQARNIMIGFLFLLNVILLIGFLTPICYAIYFFCLLRYLSWRNKTIIARFREDLGFILDDLDFNYGSLC